MEIVTKQYLENNLIAYDNYRGLGKIGQANGIATLDANGTLSSAQVPSNVVTTSSTSLMTAAEKTKLAGISDGATSTEVTEGDIESTDPNAYVVGTIKVDDAIIDLYGKDTTYQVATSSEAGLVKLGTGTRATGTLDSTNDWYPVTIDNNGKMYVNVPAQHKWKALYPNEQFQVSVTNTSGDYRGITLTLPSCISFAEIRYTSRTVTDTTVTTAMQYKSAGTTSLAFNINAESKVVSSKNTSYIFLKGITEKGALDITLSINIQNRTIFYADIL